VFLLKFCPGCFVLIDVTLIERARMASSITQSFVKLELYYNTDKISGIKENKA